MSAKLLLAVLVPPLALVVWLTGGSGRAAAVVDVPAVLAATVVPALLADPGGEFLDDAVWFNLGRSEPRMPTSGIGIPAVAPGFDGVPLAVLTGLGLVAALVLPLVAVRRRPSVWVAGAASGLALLAVLVPARTFQVNYLVLVAALLPLVLLASPRPRPVRPVRNGPAGLTVAPGVYRAAMADPTAIPAALTSTADLQAGPRCFTWSPARSGHATRAADRSPPTRSRAKASCTARGVVRWRAQVNRPLRWRPDLLVLELDPGGARRRRAGGGGHRRHRGGVPARVRPGAARHGPRGVPAAVTGCDRR